MRLTVFNCVFAFQQRSVSVVVSFLLFTIVFALGSLTAWAQPASVSAVPRESSSLLGAAASSPLWSELSASQQKILQPLALSWESLGPARKRKWIAVAQTYPQKTPAEQEKLQARMAEWAALSPRERAQARLNFAETKKLPDAANRAANWDAYQALPPEDKQKFVDKAANAPKGAALAPKQSSPDKVTPVPVTRKTSAEQRAAFDGVTPTINSKTLLPQIPKPVKPASAPDK